jgi:hypothetical protein
VTESLGLAFYAAPSGEPALGPVAFMHRPSAMDIPTAPLGHHWQDATHVSFGVLSAGVFTNKWKIEGSAFNGREPNQHRWDFDRIELNSYSARVSFNPNKHWALTTGYGVLNGPEASEPDATVERLVASAMYGRSVGESGQWSTTVVFGQNVQKESTDDDALTSVLRRQDVSTTTSSRSHSWLIETEFIANRKNTFFGRAETARKSVEELEITGGTAPQQFDVSAFSLGVVRELRTLRGATLGLGAMGTVNVFPSELKPWYGTRSPPAAILFLRLRPVLERNAGMQGMKHQH